MLISLSILSYKVRYGVFEIMQATGERFIPSVMNDPMLAYEHWHRYFLASKYVKDKVVLDIACGAGYGSDLLSNLAEKVIGIDLSEESIEFAKKHYTNENIQFKQGSISNIPLTDKSVDVIVSYETIEHVDEDLQHIAMKEYGRVLKDDGILIISTPSKNAKNYNAENPYHLKEYYTDEFVDFLQKYFKKISYAGQEIKFASTIVSNDNEDYEIKYTNYSKIYKPISPDKSSLTYLIAICSNLETLNIPNSIMVDSGGEMMNFYTSQIKSLQKKLANIEEKILKNPFIWFSYVKKSIFKKIWNRKR